MYIPTLHLPTGLGNEPALRLRELHLALFTQLASIGIDTERLTAAQFSSLLISLREDQHTDDQYEVDVECPKCEHEFNTQVYGVPVESPLSLPVIPSSLTESFPRLPGR